MKKIYNQPRVTVVCLQQQHIICTSANDYDGHEIAMPSGVVNDETAVWTKENHNVWEEEW